MKLTPENFKFGVDKVRSSRWHTDSWFVPYFTSHEIVHGLNSYKIHQAWAWDTDEWELYTPPTPEKKYEKRVMYKRIVESDIKAINQLWETQSLYKTKEEAMDNSYAIGYIEQECFMGVKE